MLALIGSKLLHKLLGSRVSVYMYMHGRHCVFVRIHIHECVHMCTMHECTI